MLHKLHKKLCTESKSRHYDHYVTGTHSLINVAYSLITKHFTHEINFTTRSCLRESGVPGWVPPVRQAQRLQAYKQKKTGISHQVSTNSGQIKLLSKTKIYQYLSICTSQNHHCYSLLTCQIWSKFANFDDVSIDGQNLAKCAALRCWNPLQNSAHLLVSGVCIWDLVLVTFPRGICHNIPTWKPARLLWWPSQHWAAVQPAIPSYAAWLGTL